jgi:SAM-dependent methyltransferase
MRESPVDHDGTREVSQAHWASPVVRKEDHGRFRYALELSRLEDGMTVVDWGCAHGWFASLIAERLPATRVVACDIPYSGGAPRFSSPRVEYHVLDETSPRLPVADASIDRIFLLDVLEHMGNRSRSVALAEIRRVLAPGGLLIVTVPHRGLLHWTDAENVRFRFPRLHRVVFSFVRGTRLLHERYGADGPNNFSSDAMGHHHYSDVELIEALRSAGLKVQRRLFFGTFYVLPWSLSMLLEFLRRTTGRPLRSMDRAVSTIHLKAGDAKPPSRLADHIGVAAGVTPS